MTPKQEEFARQYLETGCAATAYRAAYEADAMSDRAVRVEATRLLKHPNVTLALDRLCEAHQERHDMTVDRLTDMAIKAYDLAMTGEIKSASAAVSAVQLLAKIHGRIVERTKNEHTGKDGAPLVPVINVSTSRERQAH